MCHILILSLKEIWYFKLGIFIGEYEAAFKEEFQDEKLISELRGLSMKLIRKNCKSMGQFSNYVL